MKSLEEIKNIVLENAKKGVLLPTGI